MCARWVRSRCDAATPRRCEAPPRVFAPDAATLHGSGSFLRVFAPAAAMPRHCEVPSQDTHRHSQATSTKKNLQLTNTPSVPLISYRSAASSLSLSLHVLSFRFKSLSLFFSLQVPFVRLTSLLYRLNSSLFTSLQVSSLRFKFRLSVSSLLFLLQVSSFRFERFLFDSSLFCSLQTSSSIFCSNSRTALLFASSLFFSRVFFSFPMSSLRFKCLLFVRSPCLWLQVSSFTTLQGSAGVFASSK